MHSEKFVSSLSYNGSEEHPIVASLDLHDYSIYIGIVNIKSGEILFDRDVVGSYPDALKIFKKFHQYKNKMVILFEAGGHGYYPFRVFSAAGYYCKMIAPHSIPKKNRQKTDRIDVFENIKDYVAGNFRYVTPLSEELTKGRNVLRSRIRIVKHVTKKKQYINCLLKQFGSIYPKEKTKWTKEHYRWIDSIPLCAMNRALITIELNDLKRLEENESLLLNAINQFFSDNYQLQNLREKYQLIRGVGPICSAIMILEGGDLSRFSHPRKLMSFTGLVPGLNSSGMSNPHMAITKTGNKHLRYAFVCASKTYADHRALYTVKELNQFPPLLRDFLLKCQRRLHNRIRGLMRHGKHVNKARCAVARELCGFIWELAVKILPKLDETKLAA